MALIHEEKIHPMFPMQISISERQKNEMRDAWKMIDLDWDGFCRLSPKELRLLGRWLIQESVRIGREYKSNGAPKVRRQR